MRFLFLSSRLYADDFRRFLIESLQGKGHDTWHVSFIGSSSVITRNPGDAKTYLGALGFIELVKVLRQFSEQAPRVIYFDTTGVYRPLHSLLLRAILPKGLWCFDIYDNLLYDYRGIRRMQAIVSLALLPRLSNMQIALSREMLTLFPIARHLDNAAHTRRAPPAEDDHSQLVIISSIDQRFDFAFVQRLSALIPHCLIHLYGRRRNDDQTLSDKLHHLLSQSSNIIYHGPYQFLELDGILARFAIGLAPYVVGSPLTQYINPDKYYLYLNRGMEVISTDIPQARLMEDRIHTVASPDQAAALIALLQQDSRSRRNNTSIEEFRWDDRAVEFIKMVCKAGACSG